MSGHDWDYYDSGEDYDTRSHLLVSTEDECIMCNRAVASTSPSSSSLQFSTSTSIVTPTTTASSSASSLNPLLACAECNAAIYCSIECQLEDEPVHRLLCSSRRQFEERPHPNARRAIVFEHDEPTVRFAWVNIVDVDVDNADRGRDSEVSNVCKERNLTVRGVSERRDRKRGQRHVPSKYDRALLDEYLGYGVEGEETSGVVPGVGQGQSPLIQDVSRTSSPLTSPSTSRSQSSASYSALSLGGSVRMDTKIESTEDCFLDVPPLSTSPSPSTSSSVDSSEADGQLLCGVNIIRDRELKDFLSIRFRANFVEDTNPIGHRSTSRTTRLPSRSLSTSPNPPPNPFSKPNQAVAHIAPAHGGSVYCGPLVALKHKAPLWEERISDMDLRDLRDLVDYLIYYGMDKRVLYQPGPTIVPTTTSWQGTRATAATTTTTDPNAVAARGGSDGKPSADLPRNDHGTVGVKDGNGNLVDEFSWAMDGLAIVGEMQDQLSSSDEVKKALGFVCSKDSVLSKAWPSLSLRR